MTAIEQVPAAPPASVTRGVNAPTLFGAFNARSLNARQVADSFIPPAAFDTLAHAEHSLLIGPRGSGKTTLLKMLQGEALEHWTDPIADAYRKRIDYTGVFIPTDRAWSAQLADASGVATEAAERIAFAAFTTHVLKSLVEAMRARLRDDEPAAGKPHRRVTLAGEAQTTVVQATAEAWHLSPSMPTFSALSRALSVRLTRLGEAKNGLRFGYDVSAVVEAAFMHLDFLTAAAVAVEAFDDATGHEGERWALLFDELELAPKPIRSALINSFRSVDARFLFKLALSPYNEELSQLAGPTAPVPGQDFEFINLSYARRREGAHFARALLQAELDRRGLEVEPTDLFGTSFFDSSDSDDDDDASDADLRSNYDEGSPLVDTFRQLRDQDASFRSYLAAADVDLEKLEQLDPNTRAARLRKVRNLVVLREAYGQRGGHLRSRKTLSLYTGATSLFAIVEGNPRLFIGIIRRLLDDLRRSPTRRRKPWISRSQQSDAIDNAVERFLSLLRALPGADANDPSTPSAEGLLSILDRIGEYLFNEIVRENFSANPPGTFSLDDGCDDSVVATIGHALNAGAVVHVPDGSDEQLVGALRGRKYRLSYLLAPHYRLPLRLGREINLSTVLTGKRHRKKDTQDQPTLMSASGDADG